MNAAVAPTANPTRAAMVKGRFIIRSLGCRYVYLIIAKNDGNVKDGLG